MPRTPSYRRRNGYSQALVTLTDAVTKKRRDFWLGECGTPESRELYHLVIAEWEANGRRWPTSYKNSPAQAGPAAIKLVEVLRDFRRWAHAFDDAGERRSFDVLIRLLKRYFGHTPAADFGPKKLRFIREQMIRGDATTDPPRQPWSRRYINSQVQRTRRIFKWAAAREMVPVTVHQSLCALEPLKRGRSAAYENEKVGPAPDHLIEAAQPYMSRPVRALVELQLLTEAGPGELLGLRVCDLEMGPYTSIWLSRPQEHKNRDRDAQLTDDLWDSLALGQLHLSFAELGHDLLSRVSLLHEPDNHLASLQVVSCQFVRQNNRYTDKEACDGTVCRY